MSPSAEGTCGRPPEQVREAIESFLNTSRQPALIEPGEETIRLTDGNYAIDVRHGRLTVHAWSDKANLVRRITGVHLEKPGRLELAVEKFGKREGRLWLVDLARPSSAEAQRRGERYLLREQFRRSLSRQYPGWKIAELSSEANLEYSLSPVHPRALLRKGQAGIAALACPLDRGDAVRALSFGLIWLDYLRRRERRLAVEELALFLPHGLEKTTCLRLRHMNPMAARFSVFACSPEGFEEKVEPADYGNLDTRLDACRHAPGAAPRVEEWVERLSRPSFVDRVQNGDGSTSLRVRGLEFARTTGEELLFGLEQLSIATEVNLPEIERLAAELSRLRSPKAADRESPLYRLQPERWIESQVRAHLEELDASLAPQPVYGQVPAFAGVDRGVLDLLAVDRSGRLAVIELKASEDIHLPLQALDYWMRVRWHLEQDDFSRNGYFSGIALSKQPPRLLLVGPALHFHPTTEAVLRFFSPAIPVERLGLGVEWRKKLKVMFRIWGAERPA